MEQGRVNAKRQNAKEAPLAMSGLRRVDSRSGSGGDGGGSSGAMKAVIAAGVVLGGAAAAAYFFAGKGKGSGQGRKEGAPASSSTSSAAKADSSDVAAQKAARNEAAGKNRNTDSKVKAKAEKKKKKKKKSKSKKSQALQNSGQLGKEDLIKFFKSSNLLLQSEEAKKKLLKVCKEDKANLQDTLKEMQSDEWRKMGVDPQFGFNEISRFVTNGIQTDETMQRALLEAAATEEGMLLYALVGGQEEFERVQGKTRKLYEEAMMEFSQEISAMGSDQVKLQNWANEIARRFGEITKGMQQLNEIQRIERRLQMTDEEFKIIAKGEQIMQMNAQSQAAQMQQARA